MSDCLERCQIELDRCITHGDNMGGMQCIAHWQVCTRGCREEHAHELPPEPSQQETCGQGPCPECGPQYSMSSPCSLPAYHSDYHTCAYGHSWY